MTPEKITVYPARPGMKLAHPVSGVLPDEGKRWLNDSFTQRRIADGGVTTEPPAEPEAVPAEPVEPLVAE